MTRISNLLAATTLMATAAIAVSSPSLAQSKTTLWLNAAETIQAGHRALLRGDSEGAVRLLQKGLQRNISDTARVDGLSDLCIAYHLEGEYESAIKACSEAIEINPNYWRAYNNRANVYYSQEDYLEALEDYEAAHDLNPRAWQIKHNIELIQTRYTTAE